MNVNQMSPEELREVAVLNSLKKLDRALLNSALSYAVYSKNKSWYESWVEARQASPGEFIPTDVFVKKNENFQKDKLYDRAFAALIANKMSPVELDLKKEDDHTSKNYLYKFDSKYEKSVYKAMNNLAAATAVTSKNGDGFNTLHLSFRGTDTQAQPFMKFLLKAYPDMRAYYDSCKPFEEAVLKYAADPKNRISKIEVSGHSLGGAMVQHFFKSAAVRNCKVPMQGFTYGSPPAIANTLYALFPAIRHVVKEGNFRNFLSTVKDMITFESFSKDTKITQYQHTGDIVPKVGNLLMEKSGAEIVTLRDSASKQDYVDFLLTGDKSLKSPGGKSNKHQSFLQMADTASKTVFKKPMRFLIRMSQTVYHDMARYTVNLDSEFKAIKEANAELLNKKNINLMYECPNAHNFQVTCNSMRLAYQSKVKLLGVDTDFNTQMESGSKMERMDFSKLLELRKKFTNKNAYTGSMTYKKA